MCKAVYLASKVELPTMEWDGDETLLCVTRDDREVLRKHLCLPHTYYIGSYGGCGCGFCYDCDDPIFRDHEENLKGRRSVQRLFAYLREHIKKTDFFELYCCWERQEDEEEDLRSELNLAFFELGERFWFNEKEYLKIYDHPDGEPAEWVLYD